MLVLTIIVGLGAPIVGLYLLTLWLGVGFDYPKLEYEAARIPKVILATFSCGDGFVWKIVNQGVVEPGSRLTFNSSSVLLHTDLRYLNNGEKTEEELYLYQDPALPGSSPLRAVGGPSVGYRAVPHEQKEMGCLARASATNSKFLPFYNVLTTGRP